MMLPPPPIVDENPKETDKEPYIDRRDLDKNGRELSREVEAPFLPHSFRDDEIQAAQTLALVLFVLLYTSPSSCLAYRCVVEPQELQRPRNCRLLTLTSRWLG